MKIKKIYGICFLLALHFVSKSSVPSMVKLFAGSSQKDVPVTNIQRLSKQLETIKQEFSQYETKREQARGSIDRVARELPRVQSQAANSIDTIFLNKRSALLAQQHAILIDLEGTFQRLIGMLEKQRVLIEEEASLESNQKQKEPQAQAIYGFQDIEVASQKLSDMQQTLSEAEKNRAIIVDELAKRKKASTLADEEHAERKQEQENFAANSATMGIENGLTVAQQGALIDDATNVAVARQELAHLRVIESERKLAIIDAQIGLYRIQITELKKNYTKIRKSARVSRDFVRQHEDSVEQKRAAMLLGRENNSSKLRLVAERQKLVQNNIRAEQERLQLSQRDVTDISTLNKIPKNTSEWLTMGSILDLATDELLHRVEYEFLTAQSELESAQFRKDEIELLMIKSWHRITTREARFVSDDEVEQEIKSYELLKAELEGQLVSLTSSLDAAINQLDQFNNSFEKIRKTLISFSQQRSQYFSRRPDDAAGLLQKFEEIEEKGRRLLHWGGRLFEIYSTTIAATKGNIHRIESMVRELSARAFWRRSDFSIDWNDLKGFFPDMRLFVRDILRSMKQASLRSLIDSMIVWVHAVQEEPLNLMLRFVQLFLMIIGFLLARVYLRDVAHFLSQFGQGYWILSLPVIILSLVCSFIVRHLVGFYIWLLMFIMVHAGMVSVFYAQMFYLLTIPYGIWFLTSFIHFVMMLNRERKYAFISEQYQHRFFGIMWLFGISCVVLLSIREAFLLGDYHHSSAPSILLAILLVIGQVGAIGLIGRSQIVGMIPADTPFREWLHDHINRYYYVIWALLIAVIIMSTPLVGYGRQVYFIISRLLLTSVLVSLFSWIHNSVKKGSLDLFFYYADRDVIKERFTTGRFWYAIFVITTLALFVTVGIYVAAKLWGYPIGLRDMVGWLHYSFYNPTDEISGKVMPVSLLSIIHIILYLLGGFLISYVLNNFVISRVLDPFIVESGVQSTILTLLRYMIIMLTLFMGLSSTGLDGIMTKLGAVVLLLGFAIKEILSDFFSYFILLVQRPIKVGDFIRVLDNLSNDEPVSLTGFVRAITPRSIVIRKRNSTTVIIPNSKIVTSAIMNWSYSRGFFAFDDMRMTVPYGVDPMFVRQLLLDVLDRNQHVLKNPAPIVRLDDFVDNGYSFLLRGYLTSNKIGEQWDIASDVRLQIVKTLREHGIEVASPVRTVRLVPDNRAQAALHADKGERDI